MHKTFLAIALSALVSAPALAGAQYQVRVPANMAPAPVVEATPSPDPVSVILSAQALPPGTVGEPYSFNLADRLSITGGTGSYNLGDVAWSLKTGDSLPPGLTLSNGTISGAPTTKNETGTSFEVIGSYQDASGQQIYTIVVNGVELEVSQIDAGDTHTCAVTIEGAAKCWGNGTHGRLGNGGGRSSEVPVGVSGLNSGVKSISAGDSHTCAVMKDGVAKCWGNGVNGRLGDGLNTQSAFPVIAASGIASISAGANHTCAVTLSGSALCWGSNSTGQLGDNTLSDRSTPVGVDGLTAGVSSISSAFSHTCATMTSGLAKCWGANGSNGLLGDGGTVNRSTPGNVSDLTDVKTVSAGHSHSCALTTGGGVKCWGSGLNGRLGNNSTQISRIPVGVEGLSSGVRSISVGRDHSCAVTTSGAAKCWGIAANGRMGNGLSVDSLVPTEVSGLSSGVSSISAGGRHVCAVMSEGGEKCWGYGYYGQLGNNDNATKTTPVDVVN